MTSANNLIRPALERLPILDERRSTLEWEVDYLSAVALFARMNNQPMSESKGTKVAQSELKALSRHGYYLAKSLAEMHNEATTTIEGALSEDDPSLPHFKRDVFRFINAAYRARDVMADARPVPAPKPARRKKEADELTQEAAKTFERLTGLEATVRVDPKNSRAYGPFLDFLTDLFSALEIKASAESRIKAFKEKTSKKTE